MRLLLSIFFSPAILAFRLSSKAAHQQSLRMVCSTKVSVENPQEFSSKLAEFAESNTAAGRETYILFTGTFTNGRSWCPDCTAADPIIKSALQNTDKECALLECSVERSSYQDRSHPYRHDPLIKLTCVPTLMKWKNGKAVARLNDSQSQDSELVQELVDL